MTNVLDDFAELKEFAQQVKRCDRTVARARVAARADEE
jgi:hypothetical protein